MPLEDAMIRFDQILCPVDLSDVSRRALDHAVALAHWYDARLTVLQVVWGALPPTAYPGVAASPVGSALLPADRDELLQRLRGFASAETAADLRLEVTLREGMIVPEILEEARERGVNLIVMGTHGRGGFDRLLLGSIAEKTLHKAGCPVMTVPPASLAPATAEPFRTIVCALDFSPPSYTALNHALSVAQQSQGRLVLLHVLDWPPDRPTPPGLGPQTAADRRLEQEATLRELRMAVPEEARNWCRPEAIVRIGRPHEEIVRLAHEVEADLVVLGVHGRTALARPFVGSTTNQVVRHADCPVLTVR
jgi:nucleotide-binding universal stress UspA family protein